MIINMVCCCLRLYWTLSTVVNDNKHGLLLLAFAVACACTGLCQQWSMIINMVCCCLRLYWTPLSTMVNDNKHGLLLLALVLDSVNNGQ